MSFDLKPYHDAVLMADAEVKKVANAIDTLFREGTDEAKEQALALQSSLETAQAKYDEAVSLYESLKKANKPSDVAANFVPVSSTPTDPDEAKTPGVMTLAEYNALKPSARLAYAKSGGKLKD